MAYSGWDANLADGAIVTLYDEDGKELSLKWTGLQFSYSPMGRRGTTSGYMLFASRGDVVSYLRAEAARCRGDAKLFDDAADHVAVADANEKALKRTS